MNLVGRQSQQSLQANVAQNFADLADDVRGECDDMIWVRGEVIHDSPGRAARPHGGTHQDGRI